MVDQQNDCCCRAFKIKGTTSGFVRGAVSTRHPHLLVVVTHTPSLLLIVLTTAFHSMATRVYKVSIDEVLFMRFHLNFKLHVQTSALNTHTIRVKQGEAHSNIQQQQRQALTFLVDKNQCNLLTKDNVLLLNYVRSSVSHNQCTRFCSDAEFEPILPNFKLTLFIIWLLLLTTRKMNRTFHHVFFVFDKIFKQIKHILF